GKRDESLLLRRQRQMVADVSPRAVYDVLRVCAFQNMLAEGLAGITASIGMPHVRTPAVPELGKAIGFLFAELSHPDTSSLQPIASSAVSTRNPLTAPRSTPRSSFIESPISLRASAMAKVASHAKRSCVMFGSSWPSSI